jgi:hypothetical protein
MSMKRGEAKLRHEIGLRLTRAMDEAEMDRIELSHSTGFTEDRIEGWELGIGPLYTDELVALCHFLGVTPKYLLGLAAN